MARIALIDPSGRAATTVEAVLGRAHEIVVRPRIHAPGDVELVIADLKHSELADRGTLRSLCSFGPVLLLVDRNDPVPPAIEESRNLHVLRKPFDGFELRLIVDRMLGARPPAPGRERGAFNEDEESSWLEFPFVPAPAGAVLRKVARLSAPLWILGEPGCGRRRVAAAVCRAARPAMRLVALYPDERLHEVLEREAGGERFALLVTEVEQRPLMEQERLAAVLSGIRSFRLIATSVDDPAERVVRGEFSRTLYRHLEALAVQVSPLRERPIAIPPLVQALARRIARNLGSDGELSFSPAAMGRLQTYMWPGNLVELEAVLLRTLTFLADSTLDGRVIEEHEILFTAEDALRPRTPVRQPPMRGELGRFPSRADDARQPKAGSAAEGFSFAPSAAVGAEFTADPVFESIVAGLAHDLRNPMTTIKTFAGAISAGNMAADTARELGERVSEECDRLNACLEDLERYGGFGQPARERVDFAALVRQAVSDRDVGGECRVEVSGGGSVEMMGDPFQLRFVADNVLDAAREELGPGAKVQVGVRSPNEVTVEVASGQGPVTKLRRLSEAGDDALSWRIQLARAVAARNGCVVEVKSAGDGLKTVCRPQGGEVRGQQTSRINR
jgi:DNA-binding NtrC family response regulator